MTISARSDKAAARGVTLVELLVVMAILALMTGVTLTTMRPGRETLEEDAQRLAVSIKTLSDLAVTTGRAFGLDIEEGAVMRYSYGSEGWSRAGTETAPSDVTLTLLTAESFDYGRRAEDDTADRFFLQDRADEADTSPPVPPRVILSPVGEITTFSLRLEKGDRAMLIVSTETSQVEIRDAPR
ncbi:general secretion pathway protein H [Parvularcula bermudensis HTCC2503]|uniref:General secretion pathway protein H n=1 Tax=Parvularcula bermudensis (strain ATCC BAA-594 / HTCC2503 / KCTC 12087) TaxID=314260 RepID=E0TBQ4_PARBH|nr:prepilin-type N-terminal cleavage/methylation domain-containing protein [Parvularcula bermudensis]ADM09775.1 general secretion pathway protein H [Parvularcula bermudensis HTCC2503]